MQKRKTVTNINIMFVVLVLLVHHASSSVEPLPEMEQQARLIHFNPVRTKNIDPGLPENEFLLQIAEDTWGYFRDVVDQETGLPLDNIVISTFTKVNSFTSTTNIGLYLMCVVSAVDFGFIDDLEAKRRIQRVLDSLRKLETWEDQHFNYYETITLRPNRRYASSVDNGWLAAGLIVVRQTYPDDFSVEIDFRLDLMDFSKLYDPEIGQLYLGYDGDEISHSPYHYGVFCTESRVASYIAIAKGDVPRDHWFRIHRTLPAELSWQQRTPKGTQREYLGLSLFQGHYSRGRVKYVPSWGGSLFEFLMPTLVLKEQKLARKGLGLNNRRVLNLQIDYALYEKQYPVWGMSPCAVPDQPEGYSEYGVPFLGAKGYEDEGVVTPHATFLALAVEPKKAIKNLRQLLQFEGIYGEYGFYDSVNVLSGVASPRYLCLDQAMSFIALNNHLNDGAIQNRFHSHPAIAEQEDLLTMERFF